MASAAVTTHQRVAVEQPNPAQTTTQRTRPGTRQTLPTGSSTVAVQGGATGDGPADDAICEDYALRIDINLQNMERDMNNGDADGAYANYDAVESVKDMGMDQGCFFVD